MYGFQQKRGRLFGDHSLGEGRRGRGGTRTGSHLRMGFAMVMAAGVSAGVLGGCAADPMPTTKATINHPVFFKLKDPSDAEALIRDCNAQLATIPNIHWYYCGRPLETGRTSVDLDFDVALCVGFDTLDDYRVYVQHPAHRAIVADWKSKLQWLRVHDVLDEPR